MLRYFLLVFIFCIEGCSSLNKQIVSERDPASTQTQATPKLFIEPAPIFDLMCQQTPFKIDPALQEKLRNELQGKIGSFQSAWDKEAFSLVTESEKAAGRKFSRKEYSVALSVCGWVPMGDPVFLISAGPYLGSARKSKGFDMPMGLDAFVSMTHHELLHSLVDNIGDEKFLSQSQMLLKYQKEPFNVLVHLHLMAIQKAAYQRLGNNALLATTDKLYTYIGGDYQRAWEIIGIEGTEKFLKELQTFNSK